MNEESTTLISNYEIGKWYFTGEPVWNKIPLWHYTSEPGYYTSEPVWNKISLWYKILKFLRLKQ